MADSTSNDASWFNQEIAPAQPVSGKAFQSQTQALNSNNGSLSVESPFATGFASSSQGPLNSAFGDVGSSVLPGGSGGTGAGNSSSSVAPGISSANTSNTGNSSQAVAQSNAQVNSLLSPGTSGNGLGITNNVTNNNTSSGSGISGLGSTVGSYLAKQVGGTGLTDSINTFGQGLGFGTSGGANEAISPALAAADPSLSNVASAGALNTGELTSASLSSVLGAAGAGAIGGGLLAGALGENSLGGSIGGALGAGGGMALGSEIGMVGGPLGALAGGAIGAVAGGMFGNNTPATAAGEYDAGGLSPTGALTGTPDITGKNSASVASIPQGAVMNMSNILQSATSQFGFQIPDTVNIGATTNTLHQPTAYGGGGNTQIGIWGPNGVQTGVDYNPSDSTSTTNAYFQALTDIAGFSGYTDTTALYNWFYGQGTTSTGQSNLTQSGPMIAPSTGQGTNLMGITG